MNSLCNINALWLRERVIHTPTKDTPVGINNTLLEKVLTEMTSYVSEVEDTVHYPVEFVDTLNPPGISPRSLSFRVGVAIMRNLNTHKTLQRH